MPLINKIECDQDVELAVWNATENLEYFNKKLTLHGTEENIISTLASRKRAEWLSSRYLLHIMSGRTDRGEFVKDIHGKPHLVNSRFHVSISHSRNYVAVIASTFLVGIDIQIYVEKITRIEHKFVNPLEIANVDAKNRLKGLHIIWGAKESLYKAYGKKALDFKKNIHIEKLTIESNHGEFYGHVHKNDYRKDFILQYYLYDEYLLVYAKEII